jgi:hypothetical protein
MDDDQAGSAAGPDGPASKHAYVTQGTVRLELDLERKKLCVVINPVPEYSVTHRGVRYVVFVPRVEEAGLQTGSAVDRSDPDSSKLKDARVCSVSDPYPIKVEDPSLVEILKSAAIKQCRVELELATESDKDFKLIRLKVPAPTEPGTTSQR